MPTVNDPNGTPQLVNEEGRAKAVCVNVPIQSHANDLGNAYSVMIDVTTASTDDDFFYLKNSDDLPLRIYKITGFVDDANQEVKVIIGATDAGTDAGDTLTPVNMNAGSGNVADMTCTQDATDLAITGGSTVNILKFSTTALVESTWDCLAEIILPKNQRLHLEASLAGLINMTIFFYFHEAV